MYLSIPASAGHPINDVANPVASVAAVNAKFFVAAVINYFSAFVLNCSSYVSFIICFLKYKFS